MKKTLFVVLIVLLGLGVFTGIASAKTISTGTGLLHVYMEQALADKLDISLANVTAAFDAGSTLYQVALDNGIAEADLPAFMLEVRTTAIDAALADGVITQTQADRMLQFGGFGMGHGMMRGGTGVGSCGGTGIPVGTGMHRGGR
jgi:hypothetical protein